MSLDYAILPAPLAPVGLPGGAAPDAAAPVRWFAPRGPWRDGFLDVMREEGLDALLLHAAQGFIARDAGFLRELPWLRRLRVRTALPVDLRALEGLPALWSLALECAPRGRLALESLPALRAASLQWCPAVQGVATAHGLEALQLQDVPAPPLGGISTLPRLRRLVLVGATLRSPAALAPLVGLEVLWLLQCRKLESLAGIEALGQLRWLRVVGSRALHDLGPVAALHRLEALDVSECFKLASLAPIAGLEALRSVAFAGHDTVIEDGDLHPLAGLPRLAMVQFLARRHYSHRQLRSWDWADIDRPGTVLKRKDDGLPWDGSH